MYKKNTLLKVAAIFVIVGGCCLVLLGLLWNAISDLIMEVVYEAIAESGMQIGASDLEALEMLIPVLGYVLIVTGAFRLVVGIIGVKQKNAVTCIVFGSIIAFFRVISLLSSGFTSGWGSAIIAGLYLAGAIILHKERKVKPATEEPEEYYANF